MSHRGTTLVPGEEILVGRLEADRGSKTKRWMSKGRESASDVERLVIGPMVSPRVESGGGGYDTNML